MSEQEQLNKVYITGDIHGDFSRLTKKSLKEKGCVMEENDLLIILGDFSIPWIDPRYSPEDAVKVSQLELLGYKIAYIDGNHDNFDFLNDLPIEQWNGGRVHRLCKNTVHLMRGEVFTINDCTFLAFGGANSIDKAYRKPHISWWPAEIPVRSEFENCIHNVVDLHDSKIDYVLSHTIPEVDPRYKDETCNMLEAIRLNIKYKEWFYGHMHKNEFYPGLNWQCLYTQVLGPIDKSWSPPDWHAI